MKNSREKVSQLVDQKQYPISFGIRRLLYSFEIRLLGIKTDCSINGNSLHINPHRGVWLESYFTDFLLKAPGVICLAKFKLNI